MSERIEEDEIAKKVEQECDDIAKKVEQEYWEKNYPDLVQKLKMGMITKEEAEILRMFDTVEQRDLVLMERRGIEKEGKITFRNIMRGNYRELIGKKFESLMKDLKIYGMEIENREKAIILREFNWNKFGEGCLDDIISIERKCNSSGDSESKFVEEWTTIIEKIVAENVNKRLGWYREALENKLGKVESDQDREDRAIVNGIRYETEKVLKILGRFRVKKINSLSNQDARRRIIANIKLCNMLAYEMLTEHGKIDEIVVRKEE